MLIQKGNFFCQLTAILPQQIFNKQTDSSNLQNILKTT